jgi:hypothetical protein
MKERGNKGQVRNSLTDVGAGKFTITAIFEG